MKKEKSKSAKEKAIEYILNYVEDISTDKRYITIEISYIKTAISKAISSTQQECEVKLSEYAKGFNDVHNELKSDIQKLQQQNTELKNENANYIEDNFDLEKDNKELNNQCANYWNEKMKLAKKVEELKETIEMMNRLVKQQEKDISQLKNKLKNCVSTDVLKLNYEEAIRNAKANKSSIEIINKASSKFDKSIKSIKRGLR